MNLIEYEIDHIAVSYQSAFCYYSALKQRFGAEGLYVLESLSGPEADCQTALVGFNPLLFITVHECNAVLSGNPQLVKRIMAALEKETEAAWTSAANCRVVLSEQKGIWPLLRAIQAMFTDKTVDNSSISSSAEYKFGFFGYLGYDTIRFIETLPKIIPARTDMPDICLAIYQGFIKLDLQRQTAQVCIANSPEWPRIHAAEIVDMVSANQQEAGTVAGNLPDPISIDRSIEKTQYCGIVERALEHIRAGDIYQIQLGQEVVIRTNLDPEVVYLRLRQRNPAPYMYLAKMMDVTLIGASPEVFVRIANNEIVMRPLAGTAPVGADEATTAAATRRLQNDEKEKAEHVMLVDLCRNDIGRICVPRSLIVDQLMVTERYSHVIHLVSNVRGKLRNDMDAYDALSACFPAGTMTGAPKIRAMELIEELENRRRGIYAGTVGVIDFAGYVNLALCIRTAVFTGDAFVLRASAGVVADSLPEREWAETVAKLGITYWAVTGRELAS